MYNDRMEVCSPGGKIGVPLPDNVIKNRVRNEGRNPIIADVFDRMSLMERRGSRLREICTATASEDAYRPEFMPRKTLIYSRRNAPQGPPGQAREGTLWYNIRR